VKEKVYDYSVLKILLCYFLGLIDVMRLGRCMVKTTSFDWQVIEGGIEYAFELDGTELMSCIEIIV
jgi:hypothetical protein